MIVSANSLDTLQSVYFQKALDGDVQSALLCTKIIERRSNILHVPQMAVLQIVEAERPRQTSTERLQAVVDRLIAERGNGSNQDDGTTH